jgi:hypothetical protein
LPNSRILIRSKYSRTVFLPKAFYNLFYNLQRSCISWNSIYETVVDLASLMLRQGLPPIGAKSATWMCKT